MSSQSEPESRRALATGLLAELTQELTRAEPAAGAPRRAADELLPLVYEELERIAGSYLRRERADHTLDASALVHEAYLKLVDQTRVEWQGRTHFLAVGAQAMRRLLINHAVHNKRVKRGGDRVQVTLGDAHRPERGPGGVDLDELLVLDRALDALRARSERQARIVELRYFSGMTVGEVAEHLGVSKRTVEGEWTFARAWLGRELAEHSE